MDKKLIFLFFLFIPIASAWDINITFDDWTLNTNEDDLIYIHYDLREINSSWFNYSLIPKKEYESFTVYLGRGGVPSEDPTKTIKTSSEWEFYDKQLSVQQASVIYLVIDFNNPITFSNLTVFAQVSNGTAGDGGNVYQNMLFKEYRHDDCLVAWNSDVSANQGSNYMCGSNSGTTTANYTFESSDKYKLNIDATTLTRYGNVSGANPSYDNLQDIVFAFSPTTQDNTVLIDNLYISGLSGSVYNSSNSIPSFNVSYNKTCYNETKGYADINISISVYDPEDDTIYYGTELSGQIAANITVDYTRKGPCLFGGCLTSYEEDYTLLKYSDTCTVDDRYWLYNTTNHNFIQSTRKNGDTSFMLEHNNACDGDDTGVYQAFNDPMTNLNYYTEFYGFDINESLILKMLDNSKENKLYLELIRNDTGYFIYTRNESISYSFSRINFNNPADLSYIKLWLNVYENTGNYSITVYTLNTDNQDTGEIILSRDLYAGNLNPIYSVYVNTSGKIKQDFYKYNGFITTPSLSTDLPSSIRVYNYGSYPVYIYVSDSNHILNNEYSTYYENVRIDECQYYTDLPIDSPYIDVPLLSHVKNLLGSNLRMFLETMNVYEIGKSILWWIFVLMLLGIMLGEYMLIRRLDIIFPLFISSFVCFFIAWLVDYSGHMITFLILTAFSLAGPLAVAFIGGRR